jgi:N-acetylglutamate synthase-like GNAT family acetyltransferase
LKTLVIRRAREEDTPDIGELCRTIDPKDYVPNAWPIWMSNRNAINLVAQVGEKIKGCAHGEILAYPDGWAQAIRIHPTIQRKGIGSVLMAALEKELASMGVRAVFGNISAFNGPSLAFFSRQNWQIVWNIKRRLAGRGSGIRRQQLPLLRQKALELFRSIPVLASIEKTAVFRRGYFSLNDTYLEKMIAGQAIRISSGGDAYALLDPDGKNSEKRIWVIALAGSITGIQQLLEEFLKEAGTLGAQLIVDSTDDLELQALMDDLQFRPPEKDDIYFVVKKELDSCPRPPLQ